MSNLTLYELCTEIDAMCSALESAVSDEEREAIALRVSDYLQASEEKVDRFNAFLSHLQGLVEQASAEEARLQHRRQRIVNLRDRLEAYAVHALEVANMKRIEGRTSSLALRRNPSSVAILDQASIPAAFMREKVIHTSEPDKVEIGKRLKAGERVPGAELREGRNRLVRD
jgi:hypothetical protein